MYRVGGGVGQDRDLGRAGLGVDADDALEQPLGGDDVDVAGSEREVAAAGYDEVVEQIDFDELQRVVDSTGESSVGARRLDVDLQTLPSSGPIDLIVDSSGLVIVGQGGLRNGSRISNG